MPDSGELTVLIVDDDPIVLDTLRAMVATHLGPNRILSASSLRDARALLAETSPDVAVVDLWLPDGDGTTFIRKARRRLSNMRIIAITGHDTPSVKAMAFVAGCDEYLAKPFGADALVAAVRGTRAHEWRDTQAGVATLVRDRVIEVLRRPPGVRRCLKCVATGAELNTAEDRQALRDFADVVTWQGDEDIDGHVGDCPSCDRTQVRLLRLRAV